MLSSRFINKATTAELIQGREEKLLQSRSTKRTKKEHGKPKLATKDIETSQFGSTTSPKRGTTHCATAVETTRSRVFTPKPYRGEDTRNDSQERYDTHMHHRRWRRGAKLLPKNIFQSRSAINTRIPDRPLHAIPMTEE
jgi:hypothetical protein